MIEVLAALKAQLAEAGLVVHLVEAPAGAQCPYVLLWASPGQPGIEASVAADSDYSDLLGVTYADTTPLNVLRLASLARAALGGFEAGGMNVTLQLATSLPVQPDRDVVLPDTNSHPFYAVDRFQLVATPA